MSCIAHLRWRPFSHQGAKEHQPSFMTKITTSLPRILLPASVLACFIYCLLKLRHQRFIDFCASTSTTPCHILFIFSFMCCSAHGLFWGCAGLFLIDHFLIVPLFFHEIGHIPGPIISRFTPLWLMWKGYNNESNEYVHSMHLKYGHAVRIAPKSVSFNCICAIPSIYGVRSNFPKNTSAASMDNYGMPNTFSSPSNVDHRRRRNRYASTYSKSIMTMGTAYEGFLKRTRKVLEKVKKAIHERQSVDVYSLFHYYSIDNASAVTLGQAPGLLEGENIAISNDLRAMFRGLGYVFYFSMVKNLIKNLPFSKKYIPEPLISAIEAHERVEEYNFSRYKIAAETRTPEYNKSVLARLMEHKDYGSKDLTPIHVASEISDHLLAGADTLVASLTYMFWELAQPVNANHLERLIEELKLVPFDDNGMPVSYQEIDTLPWIECCLREGLRLHTPSGNIQSRVVPSGGAFIGEDWIPGGTEVGISLYSIQLNPNIYSQPHAFRPERWLPIEGQEDELKAMKDAWMTFGHGARICVGKELALVQTKLLMATIFRHMRVKLDEDQDPRDMEPVQAAVLAPKGGKCLLKFEELGK